MKPYFPTSLKSYLWDLYLCLMSSDSLKRFDRIIAILIQLQSKRIVKAQDLADRFQVSLRTIYRDIRTLEASGVPIASEAGVGYSIMEGYRLPPVMFTREEASSFVAAEKLMQKYTDKTLGSYHESAMFKIKSVLRGSQKDWITALESQVDIGPAPDLFNKDIPDALEILFESIAEKQQVKLLYYGIESTKPIERIIEPVGIFHENNYWYVMGYCHLRADYRQFRTDRMEAISRTRLAFHKEHPTLDELRRGPEERSKTKVRILVDKKIARFLGSGRKYQGFVSQQIKDNQVEMTFMSEDIDQSFARWYLMFADYATIIEPESLKDRVRTLLQDMETKLNG